MNFLKFKKNLKRKNQKEKMTKTLDKGRPIKGEYVNVIDNKTMRSVGKGKLISYTRTHIVIESLNKNYKMMFDSRVHHFEGYEPPVMLIKDENGNLIRKKFRDESIKRC